MKRRNLLGLLSVIPFAGPALSSTAEPPAEEWSSDVCVIGAGLAGLTAAIAAKTSGSVNACVLEKESLLEGHSTISTGYFSAVRHMPGHDAEYRAAVDSMIADMEKTGKGLGNPELIRILVEHSGAAYDWMTSLGVTWLPDPYEALGGLVPRSYLTSFVNGGYDYIFAVNRRLRELRIPLYFGAEVTRVTPTDSGFLVSGSRLKKKFLVHAKTVILATGGYTGNVALRSKYDPRLTSEITSTANPYGDGLDTATGDGIIFGESLGAELLDMDKILTIPFSGGRLTNYVGADVYLDESGHRFVNEQAPMETISQAVWKLPHHRFWVVTDAASAKGASRSVKLLRGIVKTADNLEEVALGMRVDPKEFLQTMDRYNSYARAHQDPEFGRTLFTQEIKKPPFYYGLERPFVHFCNGGLKIDTHACVIKTDGTPIPGLYAAGEVTGGIHGAGRLGGCSLPDCVVFGRIAGESAAKAL